MTAAEKLRNEVKLSFPISKQEFIELISDSIRRYGQAAFICDRHISATQFTRCSHTIKPLHEQTAIEYAQSEGFRVSYRVNYWGVRSIVFSL